MPKSLRAVSTDRQLWRARLRGPASEKHQPAIGVHKAPTWLIEQLRNAAYRDRAGEGDKRLPLRVDDPTLDTGLRAFANLDFDIVLELNVAQRKGRTTPVRADARADALEIETHAFSMPAIAGSGERRSADLARGATIRSRPETRTES
jgi:hypothetical protein